MAIFLSQGACRHSGTFRHLPARWVILIRALGCGTIFCCPAPLTRMLPIVTWWRSEQSWSVVDLGFGLEEKQKIVKAMNASNT
jgi:hypothetical protein